MMPSSVAERLLDLRGAVTRARGAIAEGATVELSGLDAEMARIIDDAKHAHLSERPDLLAAMDALVRELDGLAVDLRRQHDSALARQAAGAYSADSGSSDG